MDTGLIYAVTSFVCLIQIILILNRTKATEHKETIDQHFCKMLKFFIVFCIFDIFWGLCDSRQILNSQFFFTFVSYGYHLMVGTSAYIWLDYAVNYAHVTDNEKYFFEIFKKILLSIQVILILSTFFLHSAFYVDAEGIYHTGTHRVLLYVLQFAYYIVLLFFGVYKYKKAEDDKGIYKHIILFSLVPLFFDIGQYLFYDVSMYSFGCAVSALVIYSYKITAIRERFMNARAKKLSDDANTDALSELYNRRAYEDDLKNGPAVPLEDDFVYISMDLNGLKNVNDTLGHEAGDELIMGAAFCMLTCIGPYGKLYRIGGDEFVAILHTEQTELETILGDFNNTIGGWKGKLISEISISCGFVTKKEFPAISVVEMAKIADRRMYENKAAYYASKGVDRRGQKEAYNAICQSYTKILKVNLTEDTYTIIQMNDTEKNSQKGFSEKISKWLHNFAKSGQVHEDDLAEYLIRTDLEYLRNYFVEGNEYFCIYYRRMIGNEFRKAMMEVIPANDYTPINQQVFLYVKNIGK